MKIFTDLHHGDLYYSLHLLFERRLGFELYRPIGLDWFNKGYWKIAEPYGNPKDTIGQYLDINKKGYIPYKNLNGQHYVEEDIYHVYTPGHDYYQKAITLEKFQEMDFDIIMPTFPGHDHPFERLRNKYHPKAKMIMQMGNKNQTTHLPNVLHSSAYPNPRPGQNCVFYHQEISPDLFSYTPPNPGTRQVNAILNLAADLNVFNRLKSNIYNADWKYYGAGCPDGALSGARGVSEKMKEANVAFHPKMGVGHVTRGWFAIGRPIITRMSLHRQAGGDALKLFEPGATCIDLDSNTIHEAEKLVREALRPDKNLEWCKRVNKRFKQVINYDRDEIKVRRFLERLR